MNTSRVIRGMVVLGVLVLFAWGMAVSAGAAEKSAGPIMPPAGDTIKKSGGEAPFSIETMPSSGRSEMAPSRELGAGSERAMSFRDAEEGTAVVEQPARTFDADLLDHIRMEDEMSSVSF